MKGIHWVVHPPSMPVANGCFQKLWYPKLDGENNGSKPYEQMDDLGGFPPIFGNTQMHHDTLPETNG